MVIGNMPAILNNIEKGYNRTQGLIMAIGHDCYLTTVKYLLHKRESFVGVKLFLDSSDLHFHYLDNYQTKMNE